MARSTRWPRASVTGPVADAVRFDVAVRVAARGGRSPGSTGCRRPGGGAGNSSRRSGRATARCSRSRHPGRRGDGGAARSARRRGRLCAADSSLRPPGLPAPGAGLDPGLAVGDTSAVSAELDAAMKESSLSHLTAVSGANCALVVGLAFAAAAAAARARRAGGAAGSPRSPASCCWSRPSRASCAPATMAGDRDARRAARPRRRRAWPMLSLAVTVLLVADPWLAGRRSASRCRPRRRRRCSLFARPLADGLARWLPRALALALAVPLAAQLACGPLLVLITPARAGVRRARESARGARPRPWPRSSGSPRAWRRRCPCCGTGWPRSPGSRHRGSPRRRTTVTALPGELAARGSRAGRVAALLAVVGRRRRRADRAPSRAARETDGCCAARSRRRGRDRRGRRRRWRRARLRRGALDAAAGVERARVRRRAGRRRAAALGRRGHARRHRPGAGAARPLPRPRRASRASTCWCSPTSISTTSGEWMRSSGGSAPYCTVRSRRPTMRDCWPSSRPAVRGSSTAHTGTDAARSARRDGACSGRPPRAARSRAETTRASSSTSAGGGVPATLLLGDLSASPQRALAASGALDPPYAS